MDKWMNYLLLTAILIGLLILICFTMNHSVFQIVVIVVLSGSIIVNLVRTIRAYLGTK
ncbi:hypothetical protein J2Z48_000047 [Croceifilum oryzae]|uniref:Uncharacterized protein n=1 Tax=Croceifilum oryzae TaxID=1553429 RepID=A0AAJ1TCB1_9BACL|nr:hypothetical protein [Croceifilum oryzae]MDQ0415889.1 hypothetical protein [Croceifilum oryzae]